MSDDRDDEVDFEVGEEGAADYADASSMADAEAPAEPDAFDDDEFDRISGATPSPISPRRDDDAEMEAAEPPPPPPPRPRPEPRRRRQDDAPPQDWAPPEPARTERSERSERPEPSRVEPRFADRGFDRGPAPLPRPERMDQSKDSHRRYDDDAHAAREPQYRDRSEPAHGGFRPREPAPLRDQFEDAPGGRDWMPPQDARGGMPPRRAVDGEAPRMREDRARDRERERDRDRDRERDRGRFGGGPPAEVRRRSRDRSPMQDRYQVPMTRRVEERPRMDERVPSGRIDPPPPKKDARYFVMRSNNFDNVEISQEKGVWATQKSNSETLSQAFKTCERVVLFFSVNESRHYHGYGEMSTDVGGAAGFDVPWNKIKVLGDNFQVNWLVKKDLPFERISDLKNAWNENKPVKISRDGQELTPEVAKQLIEAFDSFGLESGTARKAYNAAGGSQKPGGRAPRGRPDGRYDGRQSGPGRGPRHAPGGDDRGPRNHPYARDRDGPPMRDPRDGPLRDMPPMRGHDDRFPPQRFAPYPPNRRGGY